MRIFAVPAALALACCVYMPLPKAKAFFYGLLSRGFDRILAAFTSKRGKTADSLALIVYLLLLGGALALLGAMHPLLSMLLMAPAFTGLSVLPGCARVKDELDSGKYARDIPAYEAIVRSTCVSLAPAFVQGIIAPLLLGELGMPLHLGAALTGIYTALDVLSGQLPIAAHICAAVHRLSERVFVFFLTLCAGAAGRNPLRTKGRTAEDRLLSILGIAGTSSDTHAPMSGDIAQGVFLCAFSSAILCFTLCAVGFVLCR